MSEPPGGSGTALGPEVARDRDWQRLDPRMLVVQPVREVLRFLPALLGLFVAGSFTGGGLAWQVLAVAVPVALGVLRYLTTRFRIAAGRVELRRGLLERHLLTAPLDRVRTVDVTASPIHRVLGLTTVRIGTGIAADADGERLDLDGLPAARARELRAELLRAAPLEAGRPEPADDVVVRLDPGWARYAPLTSAGVVLTAGILGAGINLAQALGLFDRLDAHDADELGSVDLGLSGAAAVAASVVVLVLVGVALVAALAVAAYLVGNWRFRLSRGDTAWHVSRGLLTTRETSLDHDRVAGVVLAEPLSLRAAGAGRLTAIVTGLRATQAGSALLVPPAPYAVLAAAADRVLGGAEPLAEPLVDHGPVARRRRWTRALGPAGAVAAGVLVGVVAGAPGWLLVPAAGVLVAAALLARDRARALGHALVAGHLVSRSGSLLRRREVLRTDAVIGWNLRASWWQRRAGVCSLVATTAGGRQRVVVTDVPLPVAVDLADRATPGLVTPFLA